MERFTLSSTNTTDGYNIVTTPPRKSTSRSASDASAFSALTTKDKEKFLIEQMRENAPDDESLGEVAALLARTRRAFYVAYIKAGFSEEQALQLCLNK